MKRTIFCSLVAACLAVAAFTAPAATMDELAVTSGLHLPSLAMDVGSPPDPVPTGLALTTTDIGPLAFSAPEPMRLPAGFDPCICGPGLLYVIRGNMVIYHPLK